MNEYLLVGIRFIAVTYAVPTTSYNFDSKNDLIEMLVVSSFANH